MTAGPPYPPPDQPSAPGPGGFGPAGPAGQGGAPGPGEAEETPGRPKRAVSTGQILGGLLFVLVIVFIIENSRSVKIRLIIPEVKAPLYVAILIAAVLGGLIAALLRYRRQRRHR
jgi:uncharacterized integral membrane protein